MLEHFSEADSSLTSVLDADVSNELSTVGFTILSLFFPKSLAMIARRD